ncbi:restriction endonuclease subunit S [Companilactobacillus pabuli]|uniref:restriction endonuclease subunit S n=1 Tax=Companilactobacillus pabuli TaxID=2714036 RepID=UPI002285DA48
MWEQVKLSDLTEFHKQGFYTTESYDESKKYYLLRGTDLTGNKLTIHDDTPKINASEKEFNDFKVEVGDVLLVRSGGVGTYGIVYDEVQGIFGSYLIDFRFDQTQMLNEFFGYFYESDLFKQQLRRISQQSANLNINAENIKSISIDLPSIEEQKKIEGILKQIDNLIALQQQQLDLYTKLKKGLLQKLFPKDGEKIPRVRFADFHEDWEQRKLKDLANVIGGGTPSTKIGEYWNGDIDWYSPVEIGKSIFVNHSQKRITKLGLNKSSAKILPINTLLFTSRAGIGNTAILKKEGTTNQGFQSIVPIKDKLDIYYLYSNSDKLKRYGERVGGGSTFTEVSGKQMKEMPITIPTIHEQKNIGHIFQLLDFQIILQENNLKKLKQLKKFLLQKLFI